MKKAIAVILLAALCCCLPALSRAEEPEIYTLLSPKGKVLTQKTAATLAKADHLVILCGHYEGVDQRVLDALQVQEISVGDYVLTGGELPACILVDCVARMVEGVLADDSCFMEESHMNGVLEYPQYTHPAVWHGREVPPVLLTGHHANIEAFRRRESLLR